MHHHWQTLVFLDNMSHLHSEIKFGEKCNLVGVFSSMILKYFWVQQCANRTNVTPITLLHFFTFQLTVKPNRIMFEMSRKLMQYHTNFFWKHVNVSFLSDFSLIYVVAFFLKSIFIQFPNKLSPIEFDYDCKFSIIHITFFKKTIILMLHLPF